MSILSRFVQHLPALTHVLLRLMAGLLFACHGAQKLLGWFSSEGGDPVAIYSLAGAAGLLELVGGLLVAMGLSTRLVAFVLSGQMAVAYFLFHYPDGFWPLANGGELAVLYCFIFLYFATTGAGLYSFDNRIKTTFHPAPLPRSN